MKKCIDCGTRRKIHMFAPLSDTCHDCREKQMAKINAPRHAPPPVVKPNKNMDAREFNEFWMMQKAAGMGLSLEEM